MLVLSTAMSKLSTTPPTRAQRANRRVYIVTALVFLTFVLVAVVFAKTSDTATAVAKGDTAITSVKGVKKDSLATDAK
jgi:hypothetical protein